MLTYNSTNKMYGKFYFSQNNFLLYLNKKDLDVKRIYRKNGVISVYKCKNAYILPVYYTIYSIDYLISTDLNKIKQFIEDNF